MRRIPIRMKLAAALAVPLIGLFFITVVEVAETAADVDDVRAQTALARASVGPSGVITAMQNERTWAVVEMIGQENAVQPPVEGYDESRRLTDEARTIIDTIRNTPTPSGQWQDLKVRISGAKVEGYLNGKLYLEHTLPAPVSGKIGVWSKADSVVYFDDYRVVPAPQG